jgi:peptidoglycan hydrolase-like protein with peptidoglycan-binding domain
MNIYAARTARFVAMVVTTALGLTLTTGTAALADPNADLIGPGPGYVNAPTAVECVQKAFGLSQDGQYGQATYDAVRNFQADNGLLNDGIVGPATGNLLLKRVPSSWDATCYSWLPTTFRRA